MIAVNLRERYPVGKSILEEQYEYKQDYFNLEQTNGKEEWNGYYVEVERLTELVDQFDSVTFKKSKFEEAEYTALVQ